MRGKTALQQQDVSLPEIKEGYSYVYQLLDPMTCEPFYIGLTRHPKDRLRQHAASARGGCKKPVYERWRSIRQRSGGRPPVMRVIEGPILDDVSDRPAEKAEMEWEDGHRVAGIRLMNSAPCGAGRRGKTWTQDGVEDAIRRLVEDLDLGTTYPTRKQFCENGLGGLSFCVARSFGGHRSLAKRLNLKMRTEERGRWDMAAAELAVKELVAKLNLGSQYPTCAQFVENEMKTLYNVIWRCLGGHRHLSQRLNLAMTNRSWELQDAEDAVRQLVTDLDLDSAYPTQAQFFENGLGGLENTILRRFGGHSAFARRLGLHGRRRATWDRESAEAAVLQLSAQLCLDAGCYPTFTQFKENGMSGLYQAIQTSLGGHRSFSEGLGLVRKRKTPN